MELSDLVARALLGSAGDAIVAADRAGLITFWNPGAERMFGYLAADALGRSLDIVIPEKLRARHWAGYGAVMASGESRYGAGDVLSVPAIHRDGSRLSVEFTLAALKDADGRISGLVAVMRDVTARFAEMRALRAQLASAATTA